MFTGIVEELGEIVAIDKGSDCGRLEIAAPHIQSDLALGDSVATDGVCLTVSLLKQNSFVVNVMPVSWQITTLGSLRSGSRINLERALKVGGRLGGHFVTGHVDGVGWVQSITQQSNASLLQIGAADEILALLVDKGSIAVSGVSLTVHSVVESGFGVSLIPHTSQHTILHNAVVGQQLNLETDILGKYCQSLLRRDASPKGQEITPQFLAENGFF